MSKLKVVITGATARTSIFLVRRLLAAEDKFQPPVGIVRTLSKAKSTYEDVWDKLEQSFYEVPDIAADDSVDKLAELYKGADSLVILTGPVPSSFKDGKVVWPPNGAPERVCWIGQRNQIDAAKKAGIGHVVVVASMGVTQVTDPTLYDGFHVFMRKGLDYVLESGLTYTIICPCELIDGEGGKREFVYSKGDQLRAKGYSKKYQVTRCDLAEVVFHSLFEPDAKNKAFDFLGVLTEESPVNDIAAAFKTTTPGL